MFCLILKEHPMTQEYLEAANKLSDLAEEFEPHSEVASIIRAGSLRVAKLAIAHGAIIKIASANDSEPLDAA